MKCQFQDFGNSASGEAIIRPIIFIALASTPQTKIPCVLDTGSTGVRLAEDFGRRAGFGAQIDRAQASQIPVGGRATSGRTIQADLIVSGTIEGKEIHTLLAMPVTFCKPWTMSTGLAGFPLIQRFRIVMRARLREYDIEPEGTDPPRLSTSTLSASRP